MAEPIKDSSRKSNGTGPLKICLMVEPSPFTYVSGYANRFQEMLRFFDTCEDDNVEVVTADVNARDAPTNWHRFRVHHTSGIQIPLYTSLSVSVDYKLQALRVIFSLKPDILHVTSPYHTNLAVYVRNYIPGIPWLEHVVWWLVRITFSFADLTLVTSPQMKHELEIRGVPRVDVWKKGINANRFHPQYNDRDTRNRMTEGNPDAFVLLYVGRLASEKRVADFEPILDASPPDTRLCLVGAGPQEGFLRDLFRNDDRVVFMGELHGEELSKVYASADVFILPSDSETLGFVVLEAMASGVPVIAARAGGVMSLIQDGVTSFLVTPGNANEYVDRISQLRDRSFRSRIGSAARLEAEKYSWDTSMEYLRDVQYRQAQEHFNQRIPAWVLRLIPGNKRRCPSDKDL